MSVETKDPESSNIYSGGHNCKFVEEPPGFLKCGLCSAVARNPQQHERCEKLFCRSCLTSFKKKQKDTDFIKCPHCYYWLNTFNDVASARDIKLLTVQCEVDHCPWYGNLGALKSHMANCDYNTVSCPLECGRKRIFLRDLQSHLDKKCLKRTYECPICWETGEYQFMTSSHLEECRQVFVSCPNDHCSKSYPRESIADHIRVCTDEHPIKYVKLHRSLKKSKIPLTGYEEAVPCKYAGIGCTVMKHKMEIAKHESDLQLHLDLTTELVLKQKEELSLLKSSLQMIIDPPESDV